MSATSPGLEAIAWQGRPALRLRDGSGASATVSLHGAHLLSWCAPDGRERLYLSNATRSGPGQAVRGGVPVIFPQFSQRGPDASLPRHGFVRTRAWQAVPVASGQGATASLVLRDDDATRAIWPQAFELTLNVQLHGAELAIELGCVNNGTTSFAFSAALHSYFAVDRIDSARLEGLQGTRFLDTTCDRETVDDAPAIAFDGHEIDRIHWGVGDRALTLRTPSGVLRIEAEGFDDAVVWNPGAQKAAALKDLGRGDEACFVCVEAAAIGTPPRLAPGGRWRGVQKLTALG